MSSAPAEPRPWSWRHRCGVVALIFVVQLGLIFWLGSTAPIRPRPPAAGLTLHLAGRASPELRALNDPTLFTLPHAQGSSGPASFRMPRPEFPPFEWAAPTNRLALAADQLGTVFARLVTTSDFNPLDLRVQPEAAATLPNLPRLALEADRSVLQLEGGLAQRRLLAPLELKSQPNPDILTNSIVQVVVGDDGRPVSVILLSGSGSPKADQSALKQAWAARFEPLGHNPAETVLNPTARLSWGRMIFRWHTVPVPPASAPAAGP